MKRAIYIFMGIVALAGLVYLLLPAEGLPRTKAPRLSDVNNLKQIGLACLMYAQEHDGEFPMDLRPLTKYIGGEKNRRLFLSSWSTTAPGPMSNVMEWTDFVYIPGATTSSPAERVVAYQPPGQYPELGANILFREGHVEWFDMRGFIKTMNSPQQQPERD
jgi:hypothetical protein